MVYTVGISSLFTESVSVDFVLNYFRDKQEVQFDTETTGFDPHVNDLICFQIGDYNNQFVIHPKHIKEFKEFLESKTLIGHNLKFDLGFLFKYGICPINLWDTFIVECVLYCGLERKKGLDAVIESRLGIKLDKSVRENIWEKGLVPEVITYAAKDVEHLQAVKASQEEELNLKDLARTATLENAFVSALAYIEFCGFKLDSLRWRIKCDNDYAQYLKSRSELDKYILENNLTKYINQQLDLFSDDKKVSINWASPAQVALFLKDIGVPIDFEKHGEIKESVGEKNIAKHAMKFPIIDKYLTYKGYEKLVGTYGENYFSHINPNTGRIHSRFRQIMDTGRLSSGGKNRETGEEYPNFQNIPSDPETRACFIAEPGNILLISDYAGQEQIVLANKSLDANLLKFYDDGLSDMHSFVASKMYKELENVPYEEIKAKHKDKRHLAKTAGFAINYGGDGSTIARNNNLSEEQGKMVYDAYFGAFPGLKDYFKKVQSQALRDGYILISTRTGRKCYVQNFNEFKETQKQFTPEFWTEYRRLRENLSPDFKPLREKVSKWFSLKGSIERMALNYPIQGTSAEITKISCIYFYRWILANNYFGVVKMVNTVHDENVVECPKDLVEDCYVALKDAMLRAGALYCKRVPLLAEPERSTFWKK